MTEPRRPAADPEAALAPLGGLARARLDGGEADARRDPGYAAVRARLAGGQRWWLWLAPVAAAAIMVLIIGLRGRAAALTFTVDHAGVADGGYVTAPADGEAGLRFSDGSEVRLARASGGWVAATGPRGARVLLDHGRASVHVVPRPANDWVFDAGPCRVHVTGTRFEMRWSASEEVLEVTLENGSVTVKGPPAPDGVVMHEGQRLVMDVRRGFARLGPLAPATAPAPAAAEAPAEEPAFESAPAAPERRSTESWSARVLAGDFAGVLREARRRGLEDVLHRGSAPEVMAVAEAARYSRQTTLARRALGAVRARFPGAAQAHKATFLLGRMAEDQDGDLAGALGWYRAYLEAAPDGPFRDEALGRQMTATLRLHGAAAARPLADQYLRRYPEGAYAKPARALER